MRTPLSIVAVVAWIWVTLARHELGHALAAIATGGRVLEVRVVPGYSRELGPYFGYVRWEGEASWIVDAAPFLVASLWFLIVFAVLRTVRPRVVVHRILFWFGLASAYADVAYGYLRGLVRAGTDVADLLEKVDGAAVHVLFVGGLAAGGWAIRSARPSPKAARESAASVDEDRSRPAS